MGERAVSEAGDERGWRRASCEGGGYNTIIIFTFELPVRNSKLSRFDFIVYKFTCDIDTTVSRSREI